MLFSVLIGIAYNLAFRMVLKMGYPVELSRKGYRRISESSSCHAKDIIRYSRQDIDFARKLSGDLEKAGYDVCWGSHRSPWGEDWVPVTRIDGKAILIIVLLQVDQSDGGKISGVFFQKHP